MPESDVVVRAQAIDLIHDNCARLSKPILEIGVGNGFYGRTLKSMYYNAEVYGIEVWPAYIKPQHLDWYKAVILSNALTFNYSLFKDNLSLIIAADVVEHFEKDEAIKIVNVWKNISPWIIVTLPIIDYEQGEHEGNVHETHRYQWKPKEVEEELGLKLVKDCGICGLFQWTSAPSTAPSREA